MERNGGNRSKRRRRRREEEERVIQTQSHVTPPPYTNTHIHIYIRIHTSHTHSHRYIYTHTLYSPLLAEQYAGQIDLLELQHHVRGGEGCYGLRHLLADAECFLLAATLQMHKHGVCGVCVG